MLKLQLECYIAMARLSPCHLSSAVEHSVLCFQREASSPGGKEARAIFHRFGELNFKCGSIHTLHAGETWHGRGFALLKVPITVYTQGHTLPIFWMVLQQTAFEFFKCEFVGWFLGMATA
jgi:hypothetical protein